MSAAGAIRVGGDRSRVAADGDASPGRIFIQMRAVEKVVRETAAVALGVSREIVSIDLNEGSRGLAVRVTAPLPVPDLEDTAAIQAGVPVLERVARIQETLRHRIPDLVGKNISRVDFIVTGAVIAQKKRVK